MDGEMKEIHSGANFTCPELEKSIFYPSCHRSIGRPGNRNRRPVRKSAHVVFQPAHCLSSSSSLESGLTRPVIVPPPFTVNKIFDGAGKTSSLFGSPSAGKKSIRAEGGELTTRQKSSEREDQGTIRE